MLTATDQSGYIAACSAIRDADLRSQVREVRAPSLIIAGVLDVATPPSETRELHASIKGSRLVVLSGAAHLSNIEQPEAFNAALLKFLQEHELHRNR